LSLLHPIATQGGVQDVPKLSRLMRRNGNWTYRVRVPDDLRTTLGKREIWRSFGAIAHSEAARLARLEGVKVDALFAEARAKLAKQSGAAPSEGTALTHEAIYRAVRAYFHRLEKSAQAVPLDDYQRELAVERAIEDVAGMHGTPVGDGSVQRVAKTVASEAGFSFAKGSLLFNELAEAVKAALDEHYFREVERLSLEPVRKRHPLFADIGPDRAPPKTMTLREAIDAFQAAPEWSNRAVKTKAAWKFRLAAWCDLLGPDRPVAIITRAEVKAARDTLMAVPPNAVKRWPDKTLAEVAELAQQQAIPPMHPKSVQLYMDSLVSLLKWLVAEGELAQNPATGIGAPIPTGGEDRVRRPMTIAELRHLFTSGPYADPSESLFE
jgi:hypothetical protein